MSETILFDFWRSSASYRVRIALNLKDVAYRSTPINLVAGAQRNPEFVARNPQGFVPMLTGMISRRAWRSSIISMQCIPSQG
jgi:maleylacetoacetate isomerase